MVGECLQRDGWCSERWSDGGDPRPPCVHSCASQHNLIFFKIVFANGKLLRDCGAVVAGKTISLVSGLFVVGTLICCVAAGSLNLLLVGRVLIGFPIGDFILKVMDFVLKVIDYVLKLMDFVLKLIDFVLKMKDFLLRTVDFAGALSAVLPMYATEIAPKQIRGLLGTLFQLAIVVGILLATIIAIPVEHMGNGWVFALGIGANNRHFLTRFLTRLLARFLARFWLTHMAGGFSAGIPAAVLSFGIWKFPESPRWLLAHTDAAQASQALQTLRAQTVSTAPTIFSVKSVIYGLLWTELVVF